MKNLFLSTATALLLLSGCTSNSTSPSEANHTDTAVPPAPALKADCDGIEPPPSCQGTRCNENDSVTCFEEILRLHEIEDLTGYAFSKEPPFTFDNFDFYGILDGGHCDSRFVFGIYPIGQGSHYGPYLQVDPTPNSGPAGLKARGFPLPLMRAIRYNHKDEFYRVKFYWLTSSPKCTQDDVMMEIIQRAGNNKFIRTFYDVSTPPYRPDNTEVKAWMESALYQKVLASSVELQKANQ